MTNRDRRFKINDETLVTGVLPVRSGSEEKTISLETDQVFYRTKMDFDFLFIGQAATRIREADIETRFELTMQRRNGSSWTDEWVGEFWKTDCEIDPPTNGGGGTTTVKIDTLDQYTYVLSGMDKEYDILDLKPAVTPVTIRRQPVLQIYIAGEDFVTNFVGTTYWQQPVVAPESSQGVLEGTYFFTRGLILYYLPGPNLDPAGAAGYYLWTGSLFYSPLHSYTIFWSAGENRWLIIDGVGPVVFEGTLGETSAALTIFTPVSGLGTTTQLHFKNVYARLLSNSATIGGSPTNTIPDPDIVEANPNFATVIGVDTDNFLGSDLMDNTPDRYGTADETQENVESEGLYFHQSTDQPAGEGVYPINRSAWDAFSIWFYFDDDLRALQLEGSEDITISEAYLLEDLISAFLAEIDPAATYSNSAALSTFYNDVNPLDSTQLKYFIIPRQRVIDGDYDQPAESQKWTLKKLFELIEYAHRARWDMDADSNLLIEHERYFYYGKNYTTPQIGIDISDYVEPQTGKPWDYGQGKYSYEKNEMPDQILVKWDNPGSWIFDGRPIDVISLYAESGNTKEYQVPNTMTDIDFILSNPAEISKNGFIFAAAALDGSDYKVQFLELTVGSETHYVQNGHLSLTYLIDKFHRDNLPALNIKINDIVTTANTVKRGRVQNVRFNAALDFDPMELISLTLGTGKIKSITEDLMTGEKNIIVNHDTQ